MKIMLDITVHDRNKCDQNFDSSNLSLVTKKQKKKKNTVCFCEVLEKMHSYVKLSTSIHGRVYTIYYFSPLN